MVGDAALREVVGADAFGAVAAADQAFAFRSNFCVVFAFLRVTNARRQYRQGLRLVLVLRTAILTFDDEAGRQVGDAYRRIGFLNVLTACARRAEGVDADVRRVDVDFFEFVSLRHHRDGTGRGVDASL